MPKPKKECAITRAKFAGDAAPLTVAIGDDGPEVLEAEPREFSTGSFGWRASGKVLIDVGGVMVPAVLNLNLIVQGSKEAK